MKTREEKSQYLAIFFFAVLTVLGNRLGLTLFFGVEFIFGSIVSLLAIALLGSTAGITVTIVGSLYTVIAWNHPYAAVVLIVEALCVAVLLKKFKANLAIASGLYWLVIGIPLAWALYRFGLGMDNDGAVLIGAKQGANGIINSVLASLLITYLPWRKWLKRSEAFDITVFQHTFHIFVGLALFPAVALMIADARSTVGRVEKEIQSSLETLSTGLSLSVARWGLQHVRAVEQLAVMAEEFGVRDRDQLQDFLQGSVKAWPDFIGVFYTDQAGTTIAFAPPLNQFGEKTVGLNFADREYFQVTKSGRQQHLSKVFMARGGVFEPVVNVVSRIDVDRQFAGIVSASINLKELSAIFRDVSAPHPFVATLVQDDGTVIVSSDPKLKPLEKYAAIELEELDSAAPGFFRRWPENKNLAPMERWKKSSLGKSVDVLGLKGWKFIVEVPTASWQSELYQRYIRDLGFLIILSIVIVIASAWVAGTISRPLHLLSQETTNLAKRGEESAEVVWPTSRLNEIRSLSDNFRSMVNTLRRRVSELEASRRELNHANTVKDEFLATLSHELRTPLNAILGHAELLDAELSDSERRESVEAIQRNAKAQNQIIADLLDVSAIVTGKITFNFDSVSLNQAIRSAVESMRPAAESKRLNLEVDLTREDVLISADPIRLQQVIWNLLSNAIKFTPVGGSISVRSARGKEGCILQVSDTGHGIEESFLPKMFDRFRQEDSSIARKHGGLGLGLSIVQQIVKVHGGSIEAKSEGKGKGSTFTIRFPEERIIQKTSDSLRVKSSTPEGAVDSLQGLKVLIVDDDSDARALGVRFLKGTGAAVVTASSVAAGIEVFSQFKPDVIVSDIGMPGEDGFAFIAKLREVQGGESVPAAAVTAFAAESDRTTILAAGFNAHVTKPVSKDELIRVVTELSKERQRHA